MVSGSSTRRRLYEALPCEESVALEGTSIFYYEAYELEFDGTSWQAYTPEPSFPTNVALPTKKQLEGFDVVTFYC